jgi:predicted AlkP superfamily pyrophosphatase or phosphodiesterase
MRLCVAATLALLAAGAAAQPSPAPRVVLISTDGANPDVIDAFIRSGVLPADTGFGRLRRTGVSAGENVPATPSLTFGAHMTLATGSIPARHNISSNALHPVAGTVASTMSGTLAPIGGYSLNPLGPAAMPSAEPLWVTLRKAGRTVVTTAWIGADGDEIRIGGITVQAPAPMRVADYSVPFGAFGGVAARGFTLRTSDFAPASTERTAQLAASGRRTYSTVLVTTRPIETIFCAPTSAASCGTTDASGRTLRYELMAGAIDSTDNQVVDYDTLIVFDARTGIHAGPFTAPSTGPAILPRGGSSSPFFFEGSGSRVGTRFFVSTITPDLSNVHLVRYGAQFIPRNAAVLPFVDDINEHVGTWPPDPDFRITERLGQGFSAFDDLELEAIHRDQTTTFLEFATRMAQRAMSQNPRADLVMVYLDQPDAAGHQFLLTDSRQATNPTDATTVGTRGRPAGAAGQEPAKIARYRRQMEFAYRAASDAVERIIQTIGVDSNGRPLSDVIVVSDHGMAPFHSAVSLTALLEAAGIDMRQINVRTSGAVANVYVGLNGRESDGALSNDDYLKTVNRIAGVLRTARDGNPFFNPGRTTLFSDVWTRPATCGRPGFCTDQHIGQDTGDVLAVLREGYNFDGRQSPAVTRLGDADNAAFSIPNFYGSHGHNSSLRSMRAIFYAAGPSFRRGTRLSRVRAVDIAPTVLKVLGVAMPSTSDGTAIASALRAR